MVIMGCENGGRHPSVWICECGETELVLCSLKHCSCWDSDIKCVKCGDEMGRYPLEEAS